MSAIDQKKDLILNGLKAGMDLDDLFIMARCSPNEILTLKADEYFMSDCKCAPKELEIDLLKQLHQAILVQTDKGKDHGVTWLLGKINPRYSDRPENGDKPGIINIYTEPLDLKAMPTVDIVGAVPEEEESNDGDHLLNNTGLTDGEKY